MQDRIKELAVEAGFSTHSFNAIDGDEVMAGEYVITDDLVRFAQAIARECEALVKQAANDNPVMGASACYGAARDIRARFGIKE